jgi:ATP-binding cassette subfamily B protein
MKYLEDFGAFWLQLKIIGTDILSINKKKAISILFLKSLTAILPLLQIYLIKMMIDQLTNPSTSTIQIISLLSFFGIIQLATALFSQYSIVTETSLQQQVSDEFSTRIIGKTSKLDYTTLETPGFQNNLYLAQQQARFRVNQLLPSIYNTFSAVLSIFFLIILFVSLKAYFFLLIVILGLPLTIHKWTQGKKSTDSEFKLTPKERESNYLFQVLTSLSWSKESRTFGFVSHFQEEFLKIRSLIAAEKNKIHYSGIKQGFLIETIEVIVNIGILLYLSKGILDAKISIGLFILYLQGIQRLQTSSKSLFQSLLQLFQLRLFVKDLYLFLELPEKTSTNDLSKPMKIEAVSIENLTFTYPNSEKPVLDNINLYAKKGEIIAIVGENGSGKSTLVKLLAGLYEPNEGKLTFHQSESASESRSFLYQDFQQYQYSAESNIHFKLTPTSEETKKAISAANISAAGEFINQMKNGYQTKLGHLHEESKQLSGGQWQKLALARIFYRKQGLVVLDEPSSALDAFAELDLYQNIKKEFSNSIVILISHRLYNLKIADRIYILKDGKIADQGNFQELIAREGLFKSMYEKQKL